MKAVLSEYLPHLLEGGALNLADALAGKPVDLAYGHQGLDGTPVEAEVALQNILLVGAKRCQGAGERVIDGLLLDPVRQRIRLVTENAFPAPVVRLDGLERKWLPPPSLEGAGISA